MCFAREENAITRKWQNQKHCHTVHPFVETCKRFHLEKSDRAATERQKPIEKTLQERKQKYKASKKERDN